MSAAAPGLLDAQRLEREIGQRIGSDNLALHYLPSCGSTNSECMRHGRHGTLVIAEHQSEGRGRRGNQWHSPASRNIYCSLGIEKNIDAEFLGLLSLQVGVSVAGVLRRLGYQSVSLKWPNDILLNGKKLGGILIETRVTGENRFLLVIGLGLNSSLDEATLQQISRPATSLEQAQEEPVDRHRLLVELLGDMFNAVVKLEKPGFASLLETFTAYDSLFGQAVSVHTREQTLHGVYQGLADTGQIQVLTDDGLLSFSASEISLREQMSCC